MKLPVISSVAVLGIVFGIPLLWAQNLGDVAREDRERRSRLSSHSPVLTNDDLARDRILTPELKNRILRTQAGMGAVSPADAPAVQIVEEQVPPPVTVEMIQQIHTSAVHQPLALGVIQPAVIAAQALSARSLAYTEPAVAVTAIAAVEEPVSVSDYNIRSAFLQPTAIEVIPPAVVAQALASQTPAYTEPAIEVIQPAPVAAQTLPSQVPSYTELLAVAPPLSLPAEPDVRVVEAERQGANVPDTRAADQAEGISLGEYARQLRTHRAASLTVQPLDPGTAEIAVTTHEQGISLGDFARQMRASRVEQLDLQAPAVALSAVEGERQGGDVSESAAGLTAAEISLADSVRQLRARLAQHNLQTPALAEVAADAPVSLGEFARQLRAVRSIPVYESASIAPLPPPTETKALEPEISLGEYARQVRMQRAAEEYMRLLAQDDPSIAAALPADAKPAIRYHEIRPVAVAPTPRQRRAVPAVVAPEKELSSEMLGHIAVTIRRGDSLWKLARIYMGSGARWQSISFLKKHAGSPDLIHAGEVILIPILDPQRLPGPAVASRISGRLLR